METPKTKAGALTEAIMAKFRTVGTETYNDMYRHVLDVLNGAGLNHEPKGAGLAEIGSNDKGEIVVNFDPGKPHANHVVFTPDQAKEFARIMLARATSSETAAMLARVHPGVSLGCLADICAERRRQDRQWGGPMHDDTHAPAEWVDFIRQQCLKAIQADGRDEPITDRFVNIAALAIAAYESGVRLDIAASGESD